MTGDVFDRYDEVKFYFCYEKFWYKKIEIIFKNLINSYEKKRGSNIFDVKVKGRIGLFVARA